VYYTKRPDKVGEIAKKIEGHSQSLELDPTTVKYVVNYDERKHFKNIEFTAGHFVGVSVLGKDQQPAFTGSAFFTTDELIESLKLLHDYCDQNGQNQPGGNEMNLSEFVKLSWGEIVSKVSEAVEKEYGGEYFSYVVDSYDDNVICRFYSYIDGSCKLMRIFYSLDEENNAILGDIEEVHVTYEKVEKTTEEPAAPAFTEENTGVTNPEQATVQPSVDETVTSTENNAASEPVQPTQDNFAENNPETPKEESASNNSSESDAAAIAANEETATFAAQDVDANTQTTKEVGAVNEQKQEENSSSAPLTDSERAEFEALKRAQKEELLSSYKEYLSEDEYNGFFATIDSVSKEELETSLLKAYKDFQERENARPITRVFSLSQLIGNNLNKKNESKESELASYIGEILQR